MEIAFKLSECEADWLFYAAQYQPTIFIRATVDLHQRGQTVNRHQFPANASHTKQFRNRAGECDGFPIVRKTRNLADLDGVGVPGQTNGKQIFALVYLLGQRGKSIGSIERSPQFRSYICPRRQIAHWLLPHARSSA